METKQLFSVLKAEPRDFTLWILANTGGIIISSLASFIVWIFHKNWGNYPLSPDVLLITCTISLSIAGVSYISFSTDKSVRPSLSLSISWPFLLMLIFGILISINLAKPANSEGLKIWLASGGLTILCLGWSSVLWLHEQGLRKESKQVPKAPKGPPRRLKTTAHRMPKISNG